MRARCADFTATSVRALADLELGVEGQDVGVDGGRRDNLDVLDLPVEPAAELGGDGCSR